MPGPRSATLNEMLSPVCSTVIVTDEPSGASASLVTGSAGGAWLLALLACGLFCYGLYCLIEARYRDLTPGR